MFLQKVTMGFDMMVLVNSDSVQEGAKVAEYHALEQASDCDSMFRVLDCVVVKEYEQVPQEWRDQQPWSKEDVNFITCEEIVEGKNPTGEPIEEETQDVYLTCINCNSDNGLYACGWCRKNVCSLCLLDHKQECLS